jgi:hypothetical protein
MRCRRVIRLLSPYVDGELDKQIIEIIERHTQSCSHCKSELDSLSLLKRLVSQKERLTKNGAFFNRLRWRLKEGSHLIGPRWIIEAGNFAKRLIPVPLMIMILIMANEIGALIGFQFRNEEFSATSRKSRDYAEAYSGTSHK